MRTLTAHNATLTTASITIRTLAVSGKQVTMALFRQLVEKQIVDWQAMTLRGHGWGHVRYLIDQPATEAINLVWQEGDDLRRCIVFKRLPIDQEYSLKLLYNDDGRWSTGQERMRKFLPVLPQRNELITKQNLEKYNELMKPLFDLPQLFIAV